MNGAVHPDVFDQRDPMGRFFAFALALHLGVAGFGLFYAWVSHTASFGARNAGGQAVGVEAVNAIPIIHHGEPNPLTNDTQSEIPQSPVKQPKEQAKKEVTPPDAIKLKTKKEKKTIAKEESTRQKYRPFRELEQNQVTSKYAPQISNPMFAAAPGSGQIGAGKNTPLGDQLPAYAAQVLQILTQNWRTNELDSRLHEAPDVDITFDIARDGSVRNVHLLQRSGNVLLDNSVQRAVLDAKLPPIPPQYKPNTVSADFIFELKR